MVWVSARGGMRSVVEGYARGGLIERENIRLIQSYTNGSILYRQRVFARALATFVRLLATRRVGFVHLHMSYGGSVFRKAMFARLARARGIPVILHLHGSRMESFYRAQGKRVQRFIERQFTSATRVLVLSESWRRFVLSIAPRARVTVLPNAVPSVRESPRPTGGADVLFLGEVGERKGVFDLLPAFAKVLATRPEARLILAGDGELERAVALARELGVDDATAVLGWVDAERRQELLEAAAICVLPSYNEGLPMTLLEAMANGLAVVASRAGGIPELVTDGETGLLVDAGDQEGLAVAISRLLAGPALRERLARRGRELVDSQYSDAAVIPRLEQIYREVQGQG